MHDPLSAVAHVAVLLGEQTVARIVAVTRLRTAGHGGERAVAARVVFVTETVLNPS